MRTMVLVVAVGVIVVAQVSELRSQAPAASQKPGTATGTLTVGTTKIPLAHAYAFAEKDKSDPTKQNHRILVTNQPLTASAMKHAAAAGSDDDARQELAVELADRKISGVEVIVGADKLVMRTNIYTPEFAMGMMLLAPTQFAATTMDAERISGKLFTEKPIQDARANKPIHYEATFSARAHR